MMKEKSGKVCRNIQEQVQKNMEDIQKLKRRTPIDSFVQHLSTDEKNVLNVEQNVDGEYKPYSIYLGTNLLLNPDGNGNFTLSASGEISGAVHFVDLLGEPTDNKKLAPFIQNNAKLNDLNEYTGFNKFKHSTGIGLENPVTGDYTIFNGKQFIYYPKGGSGVTIYLPTDKSGTLAMKEDIPEVQTIIANPDGKPTADLTSIGIDGVIYSIPQGGGGASSFADLSGNPRDNKALAAEFDKYFQKNTHNDYLTYGKITAEGGFELTSAINSTRLEYSGIVLNRSTGTYNLQFPTKSGTLATLADAQGTFKLLGGSPYDNAALAGILNGKADKSALDEKADKKQLDLYQTRTDVNLQTASKEIVDAINEVNSKATGQVVAYTINSTTRGNEPFNVADYLITATSFVDVNGFTHQTSELKATDLIIVENEGIPSRVYTGNNTFMRQATTPELENYYTKDQTNGLLAAKVDYETLGKDVESAGFRLASAQDAIIKQITDTYDFEIEDLGNIIDEVDERKQDKISDLETIRQDSLLGATAVQPEALDPINEHLDSHDKSISQAEVDIANLQNGKQNKDSLGADVQAAGFRSAENQDAIDQNIRETAEGKCKSYTINLTSNPLFNSDETTIHVETFTTVDGEVVSTKSLRKGDIVLIVETDIPDRWFDSGTTFYKLETSKVNLQNVLTWKTLFSATPYIQTAEGREPWNVFGGSESDWQCIMENVMIRGVARSAVIGTDTKGSDDAVVVSHSHGGFTGNESSHKHSVTGGTHHHKVFSNAHYDSAVIGIGDQNSKNGLTTNDSAGAQLATNYYEKDTAGHQIVEDTTPTYTCGEGSSHNHTIAPEGEDGTGKNIPAYKEVKFWLYVGL